MINNLREAIMDITLEVVERGVVTGKDLDRYEKRIYSIISEAKGSEATTSSPDVAEAIGEIDKYIQREREYQNGGNFTMFNETFIRDITKIKKLLEVKVG